jgi:nitric-oxide synthase
VVYYTFFKLFISDRLFEIPREYIREVELSHPTFDWFAKLGLKWHVNATPSRMKLNIGGISYTLAPYNRWY